MTNRNLGFLGAALLAAGLFTPIITLPFAGSINLFNNGSNVMAIFILVLAASGAAIVLKERLRDLFWPGLAASGILLYLFAALQYRLSEMRESVRGELRGNPFAGMAENALGSIQLQWGWLVLAAGAGLLVYVGFTARKAEDVLPLSKSDNTTRSIAGLSLVLMLAAPAWDLLMRAKAEAPPPVSASPAAGTNSTTSPTPPNDANGPSREEAAYIQQHLSVYDLDARYYDSMLDGHVPGVRFKIRNNGNRTLNRVTVRVVFLDANGNAIAEEDYNPVFVSQYSVSGNNTPLRPNYIWQEDANQFLVARNVPSEWQTGRARAAITDIEFGPNE